MVDYLTPTMTEWLSAAAKNPTETIEALAWRAGSYIGRNMDKLAA